MHSRFKLAKRLLTLVEKTLHQVMLIMVGNQALSSLTKFFVKYQSIAGFVAQASMMGIKENGQSHQGMNSTPREEPEKIRKWREEQKLRLEKKGKLLVILHVTTLTILFNVNKMKKKKGRKRK